MGESRRVTIEFEDGADPVRGVIVGGAPTALEFSGYLGLVSAISSLLETPASAGPDLAGEVNAPR